MKKEEIKRMWLAATLVCSAIISVIFLYAVIVELTSRYAAFKPALSGRPAALLKYAVYMASAASVMALRFIKPFFEAKKAAPAGTLKALLGFSVITAALCEIPALTGLVLFFLAGYYWDFYMLALFSVIMELFYLPKYAEWEERIRNAHGLQP